jgi:hypothetical protein
LFQTSDGLGGGSDGIMLYTLSKEELLELFETVPGFTYLERILEISQES